MPADLAFLLPQPTARPRPADQAPHLRPPALPHWHALLGSRWQEQTEKVAMLSRDCRDARRAAAETGGHDARQAAFLRASTMWHHAVAEWRALAEIEAALLRLAAGRFGWCQHCGAAMAASRLTQTPQTRYCPDCDH